MRPGGQDGMAFKHILFAVGVAGAAITTACNSPSTHSPTTPSATASTVFKGSVAVLGGQSGTIEVSVQSAVATASRRLFTNPFVAVVHAENVTATGTLRLSGSPTSLTGTYDTSQRALQLAGGGITVAGTAQAGVLAGTLSGAASGGFSTLAASGSDVTTYCGTYTTNSLDYTETGTWNIQVASNGLVSGVHAAVTPAPECCGFVTGRRDGNSVTFTTQENHTVTGLIQGNTLSGSQPNGSGTTSFRGSTDACQ